MAGTNFGDFPLGKGWQTNFWFDGDYKFVESWYEDNYSIFFILVNGSLGTKSWRKKSTIVRKTKHKNAFFFFVEMIWNDDSNKTKLIHLDFVDYSVSHPRKSVKIYYGGKRSTFLKTITEFDLILFLSLPSDG